MTNTDIFIAAVIDRSGSMNSIWPSTVESLDKFIKTQADLGKGWISLTVFDDQIDVLRRAWGLSDMPKFSSLEVNPRGMTALYDAIGVALKDGDKWLEDNPWFKGSKLCMIMTDGLENASTTLTQAAVIKLIREHESNGWVFSYLGANQDSWAVASSMGITTRTSTRDYVYSGVGASAVMDWASASTSNLRFFGTYGTGDPKPEDA